MSGCGSETMTGQLGCDSDRRFFHKPFTLDDRAPRTAFEPARALIRPDGVVDLRLASR
jgi:hypothetical protein